MSTLPEARRIAHHTEALTYEQAIMLVKDDEQLVASRSPQAPLRAGWAVIRDATHFSALMSGGLTYSLFAGVLPVAA